MDKLHDEKETTFNCLIKCLSFYDPLVLIHIVHLQFQSQHFEVDLLDLEVLEAGLLPRIISFANRCRRGWTQ